MTRLESRFSQHDSTRLHSQSVTRDSSQSHFYKITEPLVDKPSSFAHKKLSIFLLQWWSRAFFLLQWWSRLAEIFCFDCLVVLLQSLAWPHVIGQSCMVYCKFGSYQINKHFAVKLHHITWTYNKNLQCFGIFYEFIANIETNWTLQIRPSFYNACKNLFVGHFLNMHHWRYFLSQEG